MHQTVTSSVSPQLKSVLEEARKGFDEDLWKVKEATQSAAFEAVKGAPPERKKDVLLRLMNIGAQELAWWLESGLTDIST